MDLRRVNLHHLLFVMVSFVRPEDSTISYETVFRNHRGTGGILRQTSVRSLIECVKVHVGCLTITYVTGTCLCHAQSAITLDKISDTDARILQHKFQYSPPDANEYMGGYAGTPFSDFEYSSDGQITAIKLSCGHYFNGIKVRYGTRWTPWRGGGSCAGAVDTRLYEFSMSEYVVSMTANYGAHIDGIVMTTNMREFPKCGGNGGSTTMTVTGGRLLYLTGEEGCYIDGFLCHWGY